MGDFRKFLNESDKLQTIDDMISELSEEEILELAETLYYTFFEEDDEEDIEEFDIDDLKAMIKELGPDSYDDIIDLLSPEEDDEELEENVGRRLKTRNMNKKTRKFMTLSKTKLRQDKAVRQRAARATKAKRKRYYKANKMKIKSYQKSRSTAIDQGKHKVKVRRSS